MVRSFFLLSAIVARAALAAPAEVPEYSVTYDPQTAHAAVRLCLSGTYPQMVFAADSPRAMHFLGDLHRSGAGPVETLRSGWRARGWHAGECLSYSADIGAIASLHSDAGSRYGEVLITDPQYWLLHAAAQSAAGARLSIELPQGWTIAAPWHELERAGESIRFQIPDTPPDWSAGVALGHFEEQRIAQPQGNVRVAVLFDVDANQRAKLMAWMQSATSAVLKAYGRMPIPDVSIGIVSIRSTSYAARFLALLQPSAVFGGESARGQGNAIQLVVDPDRPQAEFTGDWTAIHELSHLMHPYLGDRGNWLAEGLATYYQNVLRARAGIFTPAQAWQHLGDGFADAAVANSDETLEQAAASMGESHAFQRVYWSGAAYWLSVDVELRRASGGKLNVETALSRFRDCCLPAYREWKPEDFVAKLDALTGVHTFSRRYGEFARATRFPDWRKVYADLGVRRNGGEQTLFDETAPDAAIRAAITAAR